MRSLVILLLCVNGVADAASHRRAHLLTSDLTERLSGPARQNRRAMVRISGPRARGGGVVVRSWRGDGGELHALVLTANHVLDDNGDKLSSIKSHDGTGVTSVELVARSMFLDYAVLQVTFPKDSGVHPVNATTHMPGHGQAIYSLGAATSMTTIPLEEFLPAGKERDAIARDIDARISDHHPTISTGQITTEGPQVIRVDGKRAAVVFGDQASAPGASGGPVFDSKTHKLVGIIAVGSRRDATYKTGLSPMALIANDLGKQWNRKLIPEGSRAAVGALLEELYPAAAGQ